MSGGVYIPGEYRHRHRTDLTCRAMRISDGNLAQAGRWTGLGTWARTVLVPAPGGHRVQAQVGDWLAHDGERFSVWPDAGFRLVWGVL